MVLMLASPGRDYRDIPINAKKYRPNGSRYDKACRKNGS
jgi:hypothetical protein